MCKKIFLVLLCSLILFNLYPNKKTYAAGESVALKIIAGSQGERIMAGIAEKAGVKFANKQAREKALMRWNYDWKNLDKINDAEIKARYDSFKNTLDNVPLTPVPNNPGWSKAVISGAMFITGADLIYEGYHAFKNAYDDQKFAQMMATDFADGHAYESGFGFFPYLFAYNEKPKPDS